MIPERYSVESLRRAAANPSMFLDEVGRIKWKLSNTLSRYHQQFLTDGGIDIMTQDWDNLLILDACRYDVFEEVNDIEGNLRSVYSSGASSPQFIAANFEERQLHDTVYVTANPHAESIGEDVFYTIEKVYDSTDGVDLSTARLPENVIAHATEAAEAYPNKRLIVHFMQPHSPYLGPKADELRKRLRETENVRFNTIYRTRQGEVPQNTDDYHFENDLLKAARAGYVTPTELRQVYRENLSLVLGHVETLLSDLVGQTVITSDHGELLGDAFGFLTGRKYGHPEGVYKPQQRVVPWFEFETGERKDVVADEPIGTDDADESSVTEHLKDLGYMPE